MLRYLILIVLLFLGVELSAQFGLRVNYVNSSAPNWEQYLEENSYVNTSLFGSSYSIGIDYWFRLPQKRVEFYPALSYSKSSSYIVNSLFNTEYGEFELSSFAFNINTHFYIFDFKGDCDCPTFSKKGNLVKKGLFLSIHPGLALHQKGFSLAYPFDENSIVPTLGIGAGLDIGISDLFTITPMAQYNVSFNDTWENLSFSVPPHIQTSEVQPSTFIQFIFGIRIGFRPDYK